MLDLRSECPPHLPMLALVNMFSKDPNQKFGQYRRLIVRWVDKAISEYDDARSALLNQLNEMQRSDEEKIRTGRFIYIFAFSDAIEHFLLLTRRLLRALEQLKNLPLVQINRDDRRYINAQSQQLKDARDFSEHAVEIIADGKFPDAGSLFPRLTDDDAGIEVGGEIVSFAQLAATLRRFHSIAKYLLDIKSRMESENETQH